jgi:hypothetical protein
MTETKEVAAGIAPVNMAYIQPPQGLGARLGLWFIRLYGQARRQYLSRVRPGYVSHAKTLRRGECRRCGSCCNLTFRCPYLAEDATGCLHYEKRQVTCRDFPIDALDLRLTRVPCGHYFESTSEEGARANSSG